MMKQLWKAYLAGKEKVVCMNDLDLYNATMTIGLKMECRAC